MSADNPRQRKCRPNGSPADLENILNQWPMDHTLHLQHLVLLSRSSNILRMVSIDNDHRKRMHRLPVKLKSTVEDRRLLQEPRQESFSLNSLPR